MNSYQASAGIDDVNSFLAEQTYTTQTRGDRTTHEARIVGEGLYELIAHGPHTHLAYVLESKAGPTQAVFGIETEGSFAIQIKSAKN